MMKKESILKKAILLVCISFLAAGCLSRPPLGQPFQMVHEISKGNALVYLYRPSLPYEWAVVFDVEANGTRVTGLADGSYYPYLIRPGRIEFSSKRTGASGTFVVLDVQAGQTYYIKLVPVRGIFIMKPQLTVMHQQMASPEIVSCKLAQ